MLRRYRKTEIYSVSMNDGQRSLLFSDEGKNFEVWPSLEYGRPLLGTAKTDVNGVERERRTRPTPGAYSSPESVYEISLVGSNKFRRLFETKPNMSSVAVNPVGTEAFVESFDNGKYSIYVYDVASWNLLHTWDLNGLLAAKCPGCLSMSHGWMTLENRLFFNIDLGDDDGEDDAVTPPGHGGPGAYTVGDDGSDIRAIQSTIGQWQPPGYIRQPSIIASLLGQLPDGTYAFLDYAMKNPLSKAPAQADSFLVLAKARAPAEKVIPLRPARIENLHLSPSGRYLAYTEARMTKDYRTENHLWVKDLQSGDEKELLALPPPALPSSPEPNQAFVVLGWTPEK